MSLWEAIRGRSAAVERGKAVVRQWGGLVCAEGAGVVLGPTHEAAGDLAASGPSPRWDTISLGKAVEDVARRLRAVTDVPVENRTLTCPRAAR